MAEAHASASQTFRQRDHLAYLMPVLSGEDHVEGKGKVFEYADTGGLHHAPVRAFAAQSVVGFLSGAVQTEGHSRKPLALENEQRIDARKVSAVADKAERRILHHRPGG